MTKQYCSQTELHKKILEAVEYGLAATIIQGERG